MVLLGSMAGCSASSDPVWVAGRALPSVSPTPSSSTAAAANPDRFVAEVRQKFPELALDRRDEEIADLGTAACASPKDQDQDTLSAYGVSAAQAERLRGVAKVDLCP
ncbi:hypothetical protein [Actinoplanes sp. HUAS TT8]|uniref:hypothetical protein n=1 Tax=Actinoplanes sp. HUAS TT8 TaxID=3447453 RepID=UPI003F51B243